MKWADRIARDVTYMSGSIGTSQPRRRMTIQQHNGCLDGSGHRAVTPFHLAAVNHVA